MWIGLELDTEEIDLGEIECVDRGDHGTNLVADLARVKQT